MFPSFIDQLGAFLVACWVTSGSWMPKMDADPRNSISNFRSVGTVFLEARSPWDIWKQCIQLVFFEWSELRLAQILLLLSGACAAAVLFKAPETDGITPSVMSCGLAWEPDKQEGGFTRQ